MNLIEYLGAGERGGQTRLARELEISPVLVSQWANGIRPIPIERCTAIELATDGKVTRQELRPDDWQRIWPELTEAA